MASILTCDHCHRAIEEGDHITVTVAGLGVSGLRRRLREGDNVRDYARHIDLHVSCYGEFVLPVLAGLGTDLLSSEEVTP